LPERWTAPRFPLKAADLVKRGAAQGPALGMALRAAQEVWIAADFPTEAADVAAIADAAARRALSR
jgi:poly(A) polymerase